MSELVSSQILSFHNIENVFFSLVSILGSLNPVSDGIIKKIQAYSRDTVIVSYLNSSIRRSDGVT